MNVVVFTVFHVMYFPNNESFVNIDQLAFIDPTHYQNLEQACPLFILSISVDIIYLQANYVATYPLFLVVVESKTLP